MGICSRLDRALYLYGGFTCPDPAVGNLQSGSVNWACPVFTPAGIEHLLVLSLFWMAFDLYCIHVHRFALGVRAVHHYTGIPVLHYRCSTYHPLRGLDQFRCISQLRDNGSESIMRLAETGISYLLFLILFTAIPETGFPFYAASK